MNFRIINFIKLNNIKNLIFPIYFICLPVLLLLSNLYNFSLLTIGYSFILISICAYIFLNLKFFINFKFLIFYIITSLILILFEYISLRDLIIIITNLFVLFFLIQYNNNYSTSLNLFLIIITIFCYIFLIIYKLEPIYASYHDFGFILCFNFLLYALFSKNINFFILLLNITAIIFLKGRTEIFIGLSIFIYCLYLLKNKFTNFIILLFIILFLFILINQYDINVFPDLKDRAFSLALRSDIYACVYENYISFILNPNVYYVQDCIRSVWIRNEGYMWVNNLLSYENSYILLYTKVGFFSLILVAINIYSIFRSFFNNGLLFSIILLLFFIRSITGDLYFFTYRDFILFFVIYIGLNKLNDNSLYKSS